jgi:hypothetical protein
LTTQAGQVGVIIVLIMAVLLTTGLSLAVRTTQELYLAKQTEDTTRVFNAAETGVEEGLSTGQGGNYNLENDTLNLNYSVTSSNRLETELSEGVTAMVKLSGGAANAPLTIRWSRTDCSNTANPPASLLVSIYSQSGSSTTVRHRAFRGCDPTASDHYASTTLEAASTSCSDGFTRCVTFNAGDFTAGDEFIRIKPLYNDTDLSVVGINLPTQSTVVRSTATNLQGNETRIVEVTKTLPVAPSIMDYTLFSGKDIAKTN